MEAPLTFTCPDCRHKQNILDSASEYIGCNDCAAFFNKQNGRWIRLHHTTRAGKAPLIPLGQTGILEEQEYTVMAYAQRKERSQPERWQEYWLRNKLSGQTAWLSEYNGHWLFVQNIPEAERTPELKQQLQEERIAVYRDQSFKLFTDYKAVYHHLSGEFPYNPVTPKAVRCREYMAPPLLLTLEYGVGDEGDDYSIATYVVPGKIKKAFNLEYALPAREGHSPAQVFNPWLSSRQLTVSALVFCALMFLVQLFYASCNKNTAVYSHTMHVDDSSVAQPIVTPSFEIGGSTSNVQVSSYAVLSNAWVEAAVDLVNEKTGEEKSFATGVEYYYGVDQGESWTEGAYGSEELLCSVAPGRYHMVIDLSKDPSVNNADFTLTLLQDVTTWWNALWAMGIMGGFALIFVLLEHQFEKQRWQDSPFTPYIYEDDDE